MRGFGANLVIDYRTQDFTEVVRGYDATFDLMSWM